MEKAILITSQVNIIQEVLQSSLTGIKLTEQKVASSHPKLSALFQ